MNNQEVNEPGKLEFTVVIPTINRSSYLKEAISSVLSQSYTNYKINSIFYGHGHRHIYSDAEIECLLKDIGFREVRKSSYRERSSRFGYFDTHPIRHPGAPPESSQYWEVLKR